MGYVKVSSGYLHRASVDAYRCCGVSVGLWALSIPSPMNFGARFLLMTRSVTDAFGGMVYHCTAIDS